MQNNSAYIAWLIKKQWIRDEYVATDLLTIDVQDEDYVGGYRPMILEMSTIRDFLIDSISFIDLGDTPATYVGAAGQVALVNPTEDGIIFVDYVDTFLELTDTPADYTGMAGYDVVVNQTEDGLEFIAPVIEELKYEARIDFNGAVDPTVGQGLESALGASVTLSRTIAGTYRATFGTPLTATKLIMWISPSTTGVFTPTIYNTSYIEFTHTAFVGGLTDATLNDISMEIKLYP